MDIEFHNATSTSSFISMDDGGGYAFYRIGSSADMLQMKSAFH
jgi:hypothetical protein